MGYPKIGSSRRILPRRAVNETAPIGQLPAAGGVSSHMISWRVAFPRPSSRVGWRAIGGRASWIGDHPETERPSDSVRVAWLPTDPTERVHCTPACDRLMPEAERWIGWVMFRRIRTHEVLRHHVGGRGAAAVSCHSSPSQGPPSSVERS